MHTDQTTGEAIADEAAARIARFERRLDGHLATFTTDHARRVFLLSQSATWQTRYAEWQGRCRAGIPNDPRITAFDYVETIALIDVRLGRLDRVAA